MLLTTCAISQNLNKKLYLVFIHNRSLPGGNRLVSLPNLSVDQINFYIEWKFIILLINKILKIIKPKTLQL
jgi:hypothetical protein